MMGRTLQRILLVMGSVAMLGLIAAILLSIIATLPGSTPSKTVKVSAGPYPLIVSFYKNPANAGFALPFAIAPEPSAKGQLSLDVTSVPAKGVIATPVHGSFSSDSSTGGIRGTVEITVQGTWYLHVVASGPEGEGSINVPISAVAPSAIPHWLAWLVGLLPLCGLLIFLLSQRSQKKTPIAELS